MCLYNYHVALLAQISLTLSCHPSLSSIAPGRYSRLHPLSAHMGSTYSSKFARPWEGVYKSTSLMSSSLLLQQCPACLVRLSLIVFVMGGRWPYSLLFFWVLPPGLVQYSEQHSCVCLFIRLHIYVIAYIVTYIFLCIYNYMWLCFYMNILKHHHRSAYLCNKYLLWPSG